MTKTLLIAATDKKLRHGAAAAADILIPDHEYMPL
jgi:hypothetical protein